MELDLKLTPEDRAVYKTVQPDMDAGTKAMREGRPTEAIEHFERAIKQLPGSFPRLPQIQHNVLVACRHAVEKLATPGQVMAADKWARKAIESPDLPASAPAEVRFYRAETFKTIGLHYSDLGRFPLSAAFHRKAIATLPNNGYLINLSISLFGSQQPAILSDFTTSIKPEQLAPKLLVACVPKSGSSFLYNALAHLTGWRDMRAFAPAGQFEQELYSPSLIEQARIPGVIQQHCRATEANIQMMQAFRIKPVLLVRNFADALLSLTEYYRKGAYRSTVFRDDFAKLSPEAQVDLLIEHRMPWYFEFVASWQQAERDKRLPVMWLTYEEMVADKPGTLRRLIEYWKLKVPDVDKRIEKAVSLAEGDKKKTRFNVGQTGRGRSALTDKQLEKLRSYARYFPSYDFSLGGIPPSPAPAATPADTTRA